MGKSSIIFLVGFMGCGKTTLGKALASLLHYDFADTDELITQEQAKSVMEIFSNEGESAFREYERIALQTLLQRKQLVVACGGGLPCFFDNMTQMNAGGLTVYLEVPAATLIYRIQRQNAQHRPLLQGKQGLALDQYVSQTLLQREPYYKMAELTINADAQDCLSILADHLKIRL